MFIVLTLCLHSAFAATDLYVMKADGMWDYGNPPCKIATPDLNYTRGGPTVIIPPDVTIPDDERVIVGHTRTFEVFQYIGCVQWYDLPFNVVRHEIQDDPGQCYSVCQTTYIGLSKGTCVCLSDRPGGILDTYGYCSSACVHPANTACGGSTRRYFYISFYKHVEMRSKVPDDGKYCRMYYSWTSTYEWQYCDKRLYGLCETGTTDKEYRTEYKQPWHQYTDVCFFNNMYPSTSIAKAGKTWIGEIKSRTIVFIGDAEPEDFKYGYYGYISKRDDKYYLQFTKETSSYVLCIKGGNATVVTPKYLDGHEHDSTEENGSWVIGTRQNFVAVCVVVPVVFLLTGAVVAVLVVRRQRKQNEHKGNQKVLYSNGTLSKTSHADAKGLTNATYTDEFVPNMNAPRENANCILEDQYENSAILANTDGTTNGARVSDTSNGYEDIVDLAESGNRADNYFVLEKPIESSNKHEMNTQDNIDDNYDTANAFKPINTTPNGNIYNTMSEFAEDTYNYAGEGNRQFHSLANPSATGQAADNMYSHLSKDGETDNVYNTAGEGNHQHQIDDTYNHI